MKFGCIAMLALVIGLGTAAGQAIRPKFGAFEVATVKSVEHNPQGARYLRMDGPHRFVAKDYTLKLLIAAAYDQSAGTISGGPGWVDSAYFDIQAITPGDLRPTRDEQMAMLRSLLVERFGLKFHLQQKEFSIYELEVVKSGSKLKPSASVPDEPAALISMVYPGRIVLPARNATMREFALLLQRAVFTRPVVNKTGLTGRYDFDLEWAPDETQFGGEIPPAASDAPLLPFFTAIQQQLGLQAKATRGAVDALVIDSAMRPSAN